MFPNTTLNTVCRNLLVAIFAVLTVVATPAQDPFVLAAVAFTILLTGSVSVAGPVRRALHIEPANLLREQ